MADYNFFNSTMEYEEARIKRMMKDTKPSETKCPLCNCEKRGSVSCVEGCSYLLEEEELLGRKLM